MVVCVSGHVATLLILGGRKLKQEDHRFEANLDSCLDPLSTVDPMSCWTTQQDPCCKTNKQIN